MEIFEMIAQYKVLDTITSKPIGRSIQRFTNAEGVVFLVGCTGKVYCFDPLVRKS